jgi:hypothetical protein
VLKIDPEHDRDAEHILPVWNRVEDILLKVMTKYDDPFGLAGRTKTADFAGKLKQKFVSTVGATNPGESLFQIATFQIGANHLSNHRSEKTILALEFFLI